MRKRKWLAALVLLSLLAGCAPAPTPTSTPDPYRNDYAEADVSRLEDGVVSVRYTGGAEVRVKVQITKAGGENYNYDLLNDGSWESFTVTEGNGEYTLRVLENTTENRYKPVFDCPLTLALEDPAAPFRQSCQQVFFTEETQAVLLSAQLIGDLETNGEKAAAVLEYVTERVAYDKEKAAGVKEGTVTEKTADVDTVLSEGKGICGDYAAVVAVMLRSQGVACKVVHGWAGETYHAWVEVLTEDGTWERMDPTFLANASDPEVVEKYIGDSENYRAQYYY